MGRMMSVNKNDKNVCPQETLPAELDNPGDATRPLSSLRVVRSTELLQGQRELLISHGNVTYRLIRTRNDKLMLQR